MRYFNLRRRIPTVILVAVAMLTVFSGCKPTEKGYKSAYDAALNKRHAQEQDANLPDGSRLMDVDGPQLKVVKGVQVYVLSEFLKNVDADGIMPSKYNVAVGCYKMPTNGKAQAENLRAKGLDAFCAKTGDNKFYTIAGSFTTIDEAIELYKKFADDKNATFVGLPNAPVIIYSGR